MKADGGASQEDDDVLFRQYFISIAIQNTKNLHNLEFTSVFGLYI